jgi:RNA polymerase sigma-70 factor (ECF subfamily)
MDENGHEEKKVEALTRPTTAPPLRDRLEGLFQRYHKQVFLSAHRITGNAMDAEDALQTVFMRLLRRTGGEELADDLGSYFHRAAVNAALDILRSKRSAHATPLDDADALESESARGAVERNVQDREIRERIRDALGRLSPNTAEVFTLRYFEGYGNQEIARMLGTTRSTIGVMLHRARHRLKNEIRDLQETSHDEA